MQMRTIGFVIAAGFALAACGTDNTPAESTAPKCASSGKNAFDTYQAAGFVAVNQAIFSKVNAEVNANCTPMNGSGNGSGSGSGNGSGNGSGLSGACEMAVNDCLQQTQMLLNGTSLPDCGSALTMACMDPNNLSGCQTAVMACENDAQNLQSSAGSIAMQCSQEITTACQ